MKQDVLYQILTTAEECQTVSDIAKKLFLSQPYVSQVLSKAEKKYNVVLLERRTLPIELTEAGKTLCEGLAKLHSDQMKIEQDLRRYTEEEQSYIKIGFSPIWSPGESGRIIPVLQKQFETTRFELIKTFSTNSAKRLIDNRMIDIYIGPLLRGEDLKNYLLFQPKVYLIIPETSKLYQPGKKEIEFSQQLLTDLSEEKMVSLSEDSGFQKTVDHFLEDQNLSVNKAIKVNDYDVAVQMAVGGLGWTATLEYMLSNLKTDNKFNLVELPNTTIQSDNGLTIHTETSERAKEVAHVMNDLMKESVEKNRSFNA
ncbi:LysR substrate binding domain protein [Lactobacillus equicursoris DSM 19284 = JCM 14600 = CIP 110162]|uniref:Transcriptional regulator, lysr family n=1 Tax=Lactobacillus equicursoris DSM 19284 = JCM 14600 = CIP 110162 TaxID=1293597 RepID=K0NWZ4_9LACO|nr:LysR family transcriptional regulator [Lactobacillus equicursoris]KRL03311.1 transcriptional regulator, lysr family [Lactobacillus equicursoris DSM 19284 = JCM 14600 = CIP 110162]CCK85546.1 LysR substrate binding domain protein [Lactobacillus equicursoris DSM 19284 = JCM 14600 = CIP 110162]